MNDPIDTFRWQGFFQAATHPVFLLNRRRRLLFANRAWETCMRLSLAEVRGRVCRRRLSAPADREEAILRACAAPQEAMQGESCQARRRAPGSADWWDIHFTPLMGKDGLLGILGTMRVLAGPKETPFALPEQLMALRDQQAARYRLDDLDASASVMQRLIEQARLASHTRVPITIVGERGAGKEWLARAIHLGSDRRERYFLTLDAERLPADLIAEALLGPRSGAIAPGTIYVREVGCLAREWQSKLVEMLVTSDAADAPRLIVGMRREPSEEVRAGRLVEELCFAAGTLTLTVPPLRERLAELPRLIERLLHRLKDMHPHPIGSVHADALAILRKHAWPGNIRELQDVLRSATVHAKGDRIELADLPFYLKHTPLPPERRLPLDALLEQVERRLITLAMKLTQDNHTRAAELLEIWRPRLLRRLEKFAQDTPAFKPRDERSDSRG